MAIEYISAFNSGQLSPLLIPRNDLPIYKNGCADLRNFYVLPQGGAERRQGTEYIGDAVGSESRLIPFVFSSDESYMIEISATNIKIYDSNGDVADTLTSPWSSTDIPLIKYVQSVDVIYLTCPSVAPQTISRTAISPVTFEIADFDFTYPPFQSENENSNSYMHMQPIDWVAFTDYVIGDQVQSGGTFYEANTAHTSASGFIGTNWDEITQDAVGYDIDALVKVYSNAGEFNDGEEGSFIRLSHQRAEQTIMLEGNNATGTTIVYDEVFIGANTVYVNTSATQPTFRNYPQADISVLVEKKTGAGGSWSTVYNLTSKGTGTQQTIAGGGNDYVRVTIASETSSWGTSTGSFSILKDSDKRVELGPLSADGTSDALDVSFSDWSVTTGGKWNGSVELEKSTDGGGTWNTVTNIIDTTGLGTDSQSNATFNSLAKEGANTFIRVKFVHDTGTGFTVNLINETFRTESILQIEEYIDANNVTATVIAKPISNDTTNKWSKSAYSGFAGYPNGIALHESRLVLSGNSILPSTLYMSYTDDYANFLTGTRASDALIITPTTNEPCQWLLSKGDSLYQGTRGSVIEISTTDGATINPTNVKALESFEFGGSTIQGIKTNETTVYVERLNKKLREVFYSDEEKGLVSRDLTILSNEIAGGGFTELALQKIPDQIIWGLRDDGLVATLTYERSQDVFGWAIMDFGGTVSSVAVRPTGEFDEVWIVVDRGSGGYIERLGTREFSDDLLDSWYVDSGVKVEKVAQTTAQSLSIGAYPDYKLTFNSTDHGLANGEKIRIVSSDSDFWTDKVYQVADVTTGAFILKDKTGAQYIDSIDFDVPSTITVADSTNDDWNGTLTKELLKEQEHYTYSKTVTGLEDTTYSIQFVNGAWRATRESNLPAPLYDYYVLQIEYIGVIEGLNPYTLQWTDWYNNKGRYVVGTRSLYWSDTNDRWEYYESGSESTWYHPTDSGDMPPTSGWTNDDEGADAVSFNLATTNITPYPPTSGWTIDGDGSGTSISLTWDGWIDEADQVTYLPVENEWDGFDHLDGLTCQIQGDGSYAGTSTCVTGTITTDDYYNQIVAGIGYFSILRPMYIEPAGGTTKNYNKKVNSAEVSFYRTIGGWSGNVIQKDERNPDFDFDELETDWPDLDQGKYSKEPISFRKYSDEAGEPIAPFSGSKRVNYSDTLSRIKNIFIIADTPLPMTVTSISVDVGIGGRG